MSLADDLMPSPYAPAGHHAPGRMRPSRARARRCRACGDRTMRASDRCAACAAAEYRMTSDRLPVSCWCEDTTVWVAKVAIAEGQTRTCGLDHCTPDLVAA